MVYDHGDEGNAPKSKLRTVKMDLILNHCEVCSTKTTALGGQCVLHPPIPQASSSIGNMRVCTWDGALTNDISK